VRINFKLEDGVPIPKYAHSDDAGIDLISTLSFSIDPLTRQLCPTGVCVEIPPGYVGLIHPRSGLALKQGLTILNAPGTIDPGYRGEIQVILYNSDPQTPAKINPGDRIAQLLIQKVEVIEVNPVDKLSDTTRGTGGFGSSGH
jgi:dUTP pyrophosphatase